MSNSSKTCSEAVCCDLDIEPVILRKDEESSLAFYVRLLKKCEDSYCKKRFSKKDGINLKKKTKKELCFQYCK